MSFKTHLIIIACIIVTVYVAWQIKNSRPVSVSVPVTETSPYSIAVTHASWGLNCRSYDGEATAENGNFADEADNPLRIDNVLVKVSELCNGKLRCTIPVKREVLGNDPAPQCLEKELAVEYRCFSYDRPWTAKAISGTLMIDCDKPSEKK